MHFTEPNNIFLLAFFFLFLGLLFIKKKQKAQKIKKIATNEQYSRLTNNLRNHRNTWRNVLIGLSFVFFPLSLMEFKSGQEEVFVRGKNSDIVILLDISFSMQSKDVFPNRLNRAKREIESLLARLEGERVSLIAFANSAITLLPFTRDYQTISHLVRKVSPTWVSAQGTSLATALLSTKDIFERNKDIGNDKYIIIYSDGENHDSQSIKAAKELTNMDVRIFSVGIGTKEGITLTLTEEMKKNLLLGNKNQQQIITKLQTKNLETIANLGNGFLILPEYENFSFNRIVNEISKTTFGKDQMKTTLREKSRYHYFVAILIFLLYAEIFLNDRKEKTQK